MKYNCKHLCEGNCLTGPCAGEIINSARRLSGYPPLNSFSHVSIETWEKAQKIAYRHKYCR